MNFQGVNDVKLALVPASGTAVGTQGRAGPSAELYVFSRLYNVLTVCSSIQAINDAVDNHVISEIIYDDPKWQTLGLSCIYETDDIYGHRYYEVQLPSGWTITDDGSNIIFSKEGVEMYRKAPFPRLQYTN